MSRVGKKPIQIPTGVQVHAQGQDITVKGPKGSLTVSVPLPLTVTVNAGTIVVGRPEGATQAAAIHGLYRSKISNMVIGVTQGFAKDLSIVGVGYRAAVQGSTLELSLGFSHPVKFPIPPDIAVAVEKQTLLRLSSANKELLGQVAATIRSLRPPEVYKGKGVRYAGEHILRKAGKVAGGTGAGAATGAAKGGK